jgi:hypothetical protein
LPEGYFCVLRLTGIGLFTQTISGLLAGMGAISMKAWTGIIAFIMIMRMKLFSAVITMGFKRVHKKDHPWLVVKKI